MSGPGGGEPIGWFTIVAAMLVTGVVTGVLVGLLGQSFGFRPGGGVGAAMGVVGALLIARRRQQLARKR